MNAQAPVAPPVLGRSDSPAVGGHLEASEAEGFAQSDQVVLRGTGRILELAHKSNGVSEGRVADSDRYLSRGDWVTPEILHAAVGVILLAALVPGDAVYDYGQCFAWSSRPVARSGWGAAFAAREAASLGLSSLGSWSSDRRGAATLNASTSFSRLDTSSSFCLRTS